MDTSDSDQHYAYAYEQGYRSYQDGFSIENNPYDPWNEEQLWEAWKEGYYDAGWDD